MSKVIENVSLPKCMVIKDIAINTNNEYITLSANIAFQGEKFRPMFFRVETKYGDFIMPDASPFLSALLLPCMRRGENIVIVGTIPQSLHEALPALMEVVEKWKVGFKKIHVTSAIGPENTNNATAVGCFFSGGVDSFYSYLKHKDAVTHIITIKSWEIPPDVATTSNGKDNTHAIAEREGLQVITVESNYKEIIEPVLDWEWNLGGNMAAIALMLRNGLKAAFIPSGMRWDQLCPYGTHPDLDPRWTTATLQIFHDGCEYSRLEKVLHVISKSPLALQYLRVCTHNLKDQYNCNKCFKCIVTKMALVCADVLDKAPTFDKTLDLDLVRKVPYKTELGLHIFGEDCLTYLKEHNTHLELQQALEEGLNKSKKHSVLKKIVMYFAMLDKKYNNRRIYMSVFKVSPNHERSLFFKVFANLKLIR